MSALSVSAYLSPTILRNFAISSAERAGAVVGCTIFISVTSRSFPPYSGAAQPVVDGLAESMVGDRHHGDRAGCFRIEGTKIAEKIGSGFINIAPSGQIHHRSGGLRARHRRSERQQRFAGRDT